jgi:intracellular sulfur oxidation DsrE/DsrF family protein
METKTKGLQLINRRLFNRTGLVALVAAPSLLSGAAARAQNAPSHRMVVHVGGGDVDEMNVALSNIVNAAAYYAAAGVTVAIELVANGPGYTMLREDTSPVKDRITPVRMQLPFVVFSACQNSRAGAAKTENKTIDQIPEVPEATDVPAGIVRISELQEQGWSYIRA